MMCDERKDILRKDECTADSQNRRWDLPRRRSRPRILSTLRLSKSLYTHKMNELAQSSIHAFPISFLP